MTEADAKPKIPGHKFRQLRFFGDESDDHFVDKSSKLTRLEKEGFEIVQMTSYPTTGGRPMIYLLLRHKSN